MNNKPFNWRKALLNFFGLIIGFGPLLYLLIRLAIERTFWDNIYVFTYKIEGQTYVGVASFLALIFGVLVFQSIFGKKKKAGVKYTDEEYDAMVWNTLQIRKNAGHSKAYGTSKTLKNYRFKTEKYQRLAGQPTLVEQRSANYQKALEEEQ